MISGDVAKVILSILTAGFVDQGHSDIKVKKNYQPTKQGAPVGPTIFFTRIVTPRYGHQGRKQVFNVGNNNFDKTENYWLTPTYQINAQIRQDISDPNSINAFDLVDLAAAILQTEETRQTFLASGIGIIRITEIRELKILDDSDQYEIEPSFDFVLSYNQTIISTVPVADPVELDIQRV